MDRLTELQWDNLMQQAAGNVDVLGNGENVKIMSNILKTNVSACTSIGSFFLPQLGRIWLDMLGLYKAVSGIISEQVATQGESLDLDVELTTGRPCRDKDAEGQSAENDQEGDSQVGRDVCPQSGGPRWRQHKLDTGPAGRHPRRLQPKRPRSKGCRGVERHGDDSVQVGCE